MTPSARTAILRGLSNRCPHCGQGRIFAGFGRHLPRCSHCGLVYEPNAGDTWLFTIVGDRIPIAVLVAAVYFGVGRRSLTAGILVFAIATIAIVWTAPNRWGAGVALHYLARLRWRDKNDAVPDQDDAGDSA